MRDGTTPFQLVYKWLDARCTKTVGDPTGEAAPRPWQADCTTIDSLHITTEAMDLEEPAVLKVQNGFILPWLV
jgi:hypothetical protein